MCWNLYLFAGIVGMGCILAPTPASAAVTPSARGRLAESALNRKLPKVQKYAVQSAHLIGGGELGRNGSPARIGNYTWAQLRQKAQILKAAGFSRGDRRTLMKRGVVGEQASFSTKWEFPSKLRSQIFQRIQDKYGVYIKYGHESAGLFGQKENHRIQVFGGKDQRVDLAAMVELEKVFANPKQLDNSTILNALGGAPR